MPKHLIPIFSLMIVWLGLSRSAAFANGFCGPMTPDEALKMVDVVFTGKVIAANQEAWRINQMRFERHPPFIHLTEDLDRYRTTFEVAKLFKGDITARTSVIHSLHTEDDSYSFGRGEEYIVYARWVEGELRTSDCYRNNPLRVAGEDLTAFGAGKPPAPDPSSLPDFTRRLIVLFLFLALLGWAIWQARLKYGVQKS